MKGQVERELPLEPQLVGRGVRGVIGVRREDESSQRPQSLVANNHCMGVIDFGKESIETNDARDRLWGISRTIATADHDRDLDPA